MERDGQIGHPIQRADLDLSKDPRDARDAGSNSPKLKSARSDHRSPSEMMQQMGFAPGKYMTPLQFLVAVMNDDLDMIFKNEGRRKRMHDKGGIGLSHRIEAAKTAAKYLHMQMPAVTINKNEDGDFGDKLAAAVSAGNERVRTKRIILETIERISPDVPLPPASYPPAFSDAIEGELIDSAEIFAEGDTDYDPDAE